MKNKNYDVDDIKKRFDDLDSGLTSFMKSVKEIKEIRDAVGELPEKIKYSEEQIERQKIKLEQLMSSTKDVFISFEEKSKGVLFDIEKKTDALTDEVKSGISQIGKALKHGNHKLHNSQREGVEELSRKCEEMRSSLEDERKAVSRHEESIENIKTEYKETLQIMDRMEQSFEEVKKSVFIFQKKPSIFENKIHEIDEHLKSLNKKISRQRVVTWFLIILLIAGLMFYCGAIYFRWFF